MATKHLRKSNRRRRKLAKINLEESTRPAAGLRRLFTDPASISSGWAYYVGKTLKSHGTIRADKSWPVFARLHVIWAGYRNLVVDGSVDEVHIEQLPRMCHHFTHWSVGVIGHACHKFTSAIESDIPVKSWQKFVGWDGKQGDKFAKEGPEPLKQPESEDERAAIAMGWYWVNRK